MPEPVLSENAQAFIRYKDSQNKAPVSKEGKLKFDLAEGAFANNRRFASLPDRQQLALKQKISIYADVTMDNISVFAGADEIIEIIPRLHLNSCETALVVVPTFERLIATNYKVGGKTVPYVLKEVNDFELDDEDVIRIVQKANEVDAQIIWLCTPNNPTGKPISLEYISSIARENPSRLIVVNEVYQEYLSFEANKSAASLIGVFQNLLVIRSFSKAFGLAGARIGYAIANSQLISELESFKTMFCVSAPAQDLACIALRREYRKEMEEMIEKIGTERQELEKFISGLDKIQFIRGSRTNFVLLRHTSKDLFEELSQEGISVSDWRKACGIEGRGFVRISINRPELNQKLKTALARINDQ
jgi:histidinol-phosphate aminotransferase